MSFTQQFLAGLASTNSSSATGYAGTSRPALARTPAQIAADKKAIAAKAAAKKKDGRSTFKKMLGCRPDGSKTAAVPAYARPTAASRMKAKLAEALAIEKEIRAAITRPAPPPPANKTAAVEAKKTGPRPATKKTSTEAQAHDTSRPARSERPSKKTSEEAPAPKKTGTASSHVASKKTSKEAYTKSSKIATTAQQIVSQEDDEPKAAASDHATSAPSRDDDSSSLSSLSSSDLDIDSPIATRGTKRKASTTPAPSRLPSLIPELDTKHVPARPIKRVRFMSPVPALDTLGNSRQILKAVGQSLGSKSSARARATGPTASSLAKSKVKPAPAKSAGKTSGTKATGQITTSASATVAKDTSSTAEPQHKKKVTTASQPRRTTAPRLQSTRRTNREVVEREEQEEAIDAAIAASMVSAKRSRDDEELESEAPEAKKQKVGAVDEEEESESESEDEMPNVYVKRRL